MIRVILAFILLTILHEYTLGQVSIRRHYGKEQFQDKLDSLNSLNGNKISPSDDELALAVNLALLRYPELIGHKIKIKYRKNVRHPITASWDWWNILKFRRSHTYVLLLSSESFVRRVTLNKQVGVIGHEMAHFSFYRKQPSITMLWWGLKYIVSRKYRLRFEREANLTTVDHGLGWQLKEIPFYSSREELEDYMAETGLYDMEGEKSGSK